MSDIVGEIKERMLFEGIDLFGTSDLREDIPEKLSGTPYAITIGLRMSDAVIDEIENGPTHTYFHNYRTANAVLDRCTFLAANMLMRHGMRAIAIPASQSVGGTYGLVSHKLAAVKAGLGYIGKSALFISREFGPRVRLATVLTNMPLENTLPPCENLCGTCDICRKHCPAGAISGKIYKKGMQREDFYDAAACSAHMKRAYQHIGRGAVCGICISVCPKGKN